MPATLICNNGHNPDSTLAWRCDICGEPLEVTGLDQFDTDAINRDEWSLWRYDALLPVNKLFSLGEGMTSLVNTKLYGRDIAAKLEFLNPTGSYKDRGTVMLLNYLLSQGVTNVVEDSSGNAGASIAMYASAGGLTARVFVPANAPENKIRQISFGAEVIRVEGSRADVTDACLSVLNASVVYASHAWNPYFVLGQMTIAWELWEQNNRTIPEAIIAPVGQGSVILGLYRGFVMLQEAGLIDQLPRLYGVQAAACDPVVRGFEQGTEAPIAVDPSPSIADGIMVGDPIRGKAILQAIRNSGGKALRVTEPEIRQAQMTLATCGLFVEPTSATVAAALRNLEDDAESVTLILTGHGLKAVN